MCILFDSLMLLAVIYFRGIMKGGIKDALSEGQSWKQEPQSSCPHDTCNLVVRVKTRKPLSSFTKAQA